MADYDIPNDLRYSEDDEWVRQDDDSVTVGITDYAQQQLGDIVFLELPEVGATIDKGEPFGVIESVKTASDIYAPLSGEVVAVNPDLADQPGLVNTDPYGAGWFFKIKLADPAEVEALRDAGQYRAQIGA